MPRRAAAVRREVMPDVKYNNRLVTQLINKVLLDGKKATAERIVYTAFDMVAAKSGEDALSVFKKAMDNIRPTLEVKPKRVGGQPARHPLDGQLLACPQGEDHGRAPCQRDSRRLQWRWRFREAS